MTNRPDDLLDEDALDAALDRFAAAPGSTMSPAWLARVDGRLRELDAAFARPVDGNRMAALPLVAPTVGEASLQVSRSAAPSQTSVGRFARLTAVAAVLALALLGTFAFAGSPGGWFEDEHGPHGASIPAVGTPVEQAYAESMVVVLSTCALPPLTRERYDATIGTATPTANADFREIFAAKTDEIRQLIVPMVIDGRVVLTGGERVSEEMAGGIGDALSRYLTCAYDGDYARTAGFLSDDFIRMIPNADEFFAELQATPDPSVTPVPLLELPVEQLRLLSDGRVAVVANIPQSDVQDGAGDYVPPTPTGAMAVEGQVFIFVKTPDGWRLDYYNSGEVFRVPLEPASATPTAP